MIKYAVGDRLVHNGESNQFYKLFVPGTIYRVDRIDTAGLIFIEDKRPKDGWSSDILSSCTVLLTTEKYLKLCE